MRLRGLRREHRIVLVAFVCACAGSGVLADDWPMWRKDAQRSAADPEKWLGDLPSKLTHLQWARELPLPAPAWGTDMSRVRHLANYNPDRSYEPVVAGGTMFVPSMVNDTLTALDAATGEEKWRFYTDGPIRFAPAVWEENVYVGSDDGHLYCLDAKKGTLKWKFSGTPNDRKVIGSDRLISACPVRGGPVVADGRVYFAAGIWAVMGSFLYAVDARTGEKAWVNDSVSALLVGGRKDVKWGYGKVVNPFGYVYPGAGSLTGVVPYGHLGTADLEDKPVLVVPNGIHPAPSIFDRETGRVLYAGGFIPSLDGNTTAFNRPKWLLRHKTIGTEIKKRYGKYIEGFFGKRPPGKKDKVEVWQVSGTGREAKLGPYTPGPKGKRTPGEVTSLLTAGGRLFTVTVEGWIYCFGAEAGAAGMHTLVAKKAESAAKWKDMASRILEKTKPVPTYCVVLGLEDGGLAEAVLAASPGMRVIAIDPDAKKVDALRRRLDAASLYGTRASAHVGDPVSYGLPPYMASLIVSERSDRKWSDAKKSIETIYRALRPYGGAACLALTQEQHQALVARVAEAKLPGAEVTRDGELSLLRRAGGLPGAAGWTHGFGNPANTLASADSHVRAPLGVVWFNGEPGGPGKGGRPLVAEGRLIFSRGDVIMDVYTGRMMKNIGKKGHPLVIGDSGYYAPSRGAILLHDPHTGKALKQMKLPADAGSVTHLMLSGKRLLAEAEKLIAAFDAESGSSLWHVKTSGAIPAAGTRGRSGHNTAAGRGRLFLTHWMTAEQLPALQGKAGAKDGKYPVLAALDTATGKPAWHTVLPETDNVLLVYSEERDILLRVPRPYYKKVGLDRYRLTAYQGDDGTVLWDRTPIVTAGPPVLIGNKIIFYRKAAEDPGIYQFITAVDLLTGKDVMKKDPLTGEQVPWRVEKGSGCNYVTGSVNLLTVRSQTGAFADLPTGSGIGYLGQFRTSCHNTIVAADGMVTSPQSGCACLYTLAASVGYTYMPDAELWTTYGTVRGEGPIRRVGLNLGAPGDRVTGDGTLWLDYPSVGFRSPDVPVSVEPETTRYFVHHSATMKGGPMPWVAASGAEGPSSIAVTLAKESGAERAYTVRLFFAEDDEKRKPGERVFSVSVQGSEVLKDFDIVKEAGGSRRGIVREFKGIKAGDVLDIELKAAASSKAPPVLCGIVAIAE
jgi:outer membrane protein assembly factor BamB/SAM-dependent methyltransferase